MKKATLLTISLFAVLAVFAGSKEQKKGKVISNPINPGFYPDPSICQEGDDYYMVNSTFCWYPGIPVFHSRDLVNWKQIGHVLDRPSQLQLDGLQISRGVYAPAIEYHDGVFYVLNTLVDAGGNFVVTAKNPAGPWSDPLWLPEIDGIDPSLFFDDNGKSYIINNGPPPENKSEYNGHRALWIQEFDYKNLKLVGPRKIIVNGGVDISEKPSWIEGPHIYKIDGWYYLMAAEGGTAEAHSEVIFRSKDVWGPYVPWENNPILTQGGLDASRPNPITSTGHADLFKTKNGEWWAIFLGCQPYEPFAENHFNTGRETFMAPVKWENGWPVIGEKTAALKREYPAPDLKQYKPKGYAPLNSLNPVRDDFKTGKLAFYWNFMRTSKEEWYSLNVKTGTLQIKARPELLSDKGNPSFIGRRQQHANCVATTSFHFSPKNENDEAGLVIWQNERHYYSLVKTMAEGKQVVRLLKVNQVVAEKELTTDGLFEFKIEAKGKDYDFSFRQPNGTWETLAANVDGTFISTKGAGGFVGAYFGMVAKGSGNNSAMFDWFEYLPKK